jgi:hypothetical protein
MLRIMDWKRVAVGEDQTDNKNTIGRVTKVSLEIEPKEENELLILLL